MIVGQCHPCVLRQAAKCLIKPATPTRRVVSFNRPTKPYSSAASRVSISYRAGPQSRRGFHGSRALPGRVALGTGLGNSVPPYERRLAYLRFFGISLMVVVGTFMSHPMLVQMTVTTWDLRPSDADTTFETSFFGLISIIYGLLVGNSFLFLHERQTLLVQELFHEVFAIELLLQQATVVIRDDDLKIRMVDGIRQYVADEIYQPTDMESPFMPTSSFMQLVGLMARVKHTGAGDTNVGMVQALEKLAGAQSRRSAVAVQLLPKFHWVFLHLVESIFIITLLAFQAAHLDVGESMSHERQLAFAALCGFLTLTSLMLYDISDPVNGLYGFRDSLDKRLQYVDILLASMLHVQQRASTEQMDGEKRMHEGLEELRDLGIMEHLAAMAPPKLRRRAGRVAVGSTSGNFSMPFTFPRRSTSIMDSMDSPSSDPLEVEDQSSDTINGNGSTSEAPGLPSSIYSIRS